MTRLRVAAIAVVLVAALAGVLALGLWQRPHSSSADPTEAITVKRALSSAAIPFGDRVEAEVDVVTRDASIPAESVRVGTSFAPFGVVARRVERAKAGGATLLSTTITLQCLTRACLPPRTGGRVVQFRPISVTYAKDGRSSTLVVPWRPLQVTSRLPQGAAAGVGIVDTAPALDPRFRHSPDSVVWLLRLATLLLVLGGAALVVTALWPGSLRARRHLARLSPLERSLLLVEAAADGEDEVERRRTLDLLALRLGEARAPELELRTQELAWGQAPPEPEALTVLAAQVRATLNGKVGS